jgi:indole-3-glycerol phosphate synthase
MSETILQRILSTTRADLERRKRQLPPAELYAQTATTDASIGSPRRSLRGALGSGSISVVAEFKRRSPSAGALANHPDLAQIAGAYERGGAAAMSVLTEGPHFGGSLEDLERARASCELPLLRKDFIIDDYQLHEAAAAGADGALLIVAALDARQLESLHHAARALELDALVEVHDRSELEIALQAGAQLIGINNRNLNDFTVDLGRTVELMADVPADVTVVSESGISTSEQLRQLESLGVDAVLVGESLMRSPDPESALAGLKRSRAPLGG